MTTWGSSWGSSWGGGGGVIKWGTRESNEAGSPFVRIPAGQLDVIQTAFDRIYKQFEGRATWEDFTDVLGSLLQEIEDANAEVQRQKYIDTAVGVQLEKIGEAINRSRGSLTDDDLYRIAIVVDMATIQGANSLPQVLQLVQTILQDTVSVRVRDRYPATFEIVADDIPADIYSLLQDIMRDVPGAGIGLVLSSRSATANGGWASVYGPVDNGASFGSVTGATTTLSPFRTGRGIRS
jgi:hypothetical protein